MKFLVLTSIFEKFKYNIKQRGWGRMVVRSMKLEQLEQLSRIMEEFCKGNCANSTVTEYVNRVKCTAKDANTLMSLFLMQNDCVSQNKSATDKCIKILPRFITNMQHIFNIETFFRICEQVKCLSNEEDISFWLERCFLLSICEVDSYLHLNRNIINEFLEFSGNKLIQTEIVNSLSTFEYSYMNEAGDRFIILPAIYSSAKKKIDKVFDNTASAENNSDIIIELKHENSCCNELKSCFDISNTMSDDIVAQSVFEFLYELCSNEYAIDEHNIEYIVNWDSNIKNLIPYLHNNREHQFTKLVRYLFEKLEKDGYIGRILGTDTNVDVYQIITYLNRFNISLIDCMEIKNSDNNSVFTDDISSRGVDASCEVLDCGYLFTQKTLVSNSTMPENVIIRFPSLIVRIPYLFSLLPNEYPEYFTLLQVYAKSTGSVATNTLIIKSTSEFISKNKDFFSILLANEDFFFLHLTEKYNCRFEITKQKKLLYKSLINLCHDVGIDTPIKSTFLNRWIDKNKLSTIKKSKDSMLLTAKEKRTCVYLENSISGYKSKLPYIITRTLVVFTSNGEKNLLCDEYNVAEYMESCELHDSNMLDEQDVFLIERMLTTTSLDSVEFEQFLSSNRVLKIMTNLYMSSENDRLFSFLENAIIKNNGYSLIIPCVTVDEIADAAAISNCNCSFIPTENKSDDGLCQEIVFGLRRKSQNLIKPKCTLFKFEPTLFLSAFINFLGGVNIPLQYNEQMTSLNVMIESLIKVIKFLEVNNLNEWSFSNKKDMVMRNNSFSFLYEENADEELRILKQFFLSDTQSAETIEQFESFSSFFTKKWNSVLEELDEYGIKRIPITPNETIVTEKQLNRGWEIQNDKNKYTDNNDRDYLVYEIVQNGIEIDGNIIRKPIVNVYTFRE